MKKFVVAILAFLYITVVSGVVVNVHYCMGKIASVKYGTHSTDHCGKCGMKSKPGCCHTDTKLVKLQNAHLASSSPVALQVPAALPALPQIPLFAVTSTASLQTSHCLSPPDFTDNLAYLLQCVFRI